MYPTIVTIEYWDGDECILKTEGALIYAKNFVEAAEQIERYYGDTIGSMKIQMYEEGLFTIDTENIEMIEEKL